MNERKVSYGAAYESLHDEDFLYTHVPMRDTGGMPVYPTPSSTFRALDSYEDQSCEHPGWELSVAKVFCDALRVAAGRQVHGYDEPQWWEQ